MLNRAIVLLALITAHGCFYNPKGSTGDLTGSTTESTTSSPIPTPTATTDDKPACGNGALEPGELCDDGNATPGDGCEVDCTKTPGELCGNGMVDEGEECDDGNHVAMDGCEYNCTETVIPASCGDGKTDVREECDDGNADDSDACRDNCKNAACGDGIVHVGAEACDDGNKSNTALAKHLRSTASSLPGPIRCLAEVLQFPTEPDRTRSRGGNQPLGGVLATPRQRLAARLARTRSRAPPWWEERCRPCKRARCHPLPDKAAQDEEIAPNCGERRSRGATRTGDVPAPSAC
ncbi:DUF4215 domain-containing protein [Nannocystis sp. ILAH1]|uniref:DUF4215 domain-containing protein n=1 Tax=Nannocystis sp. ILAH1 TaxID=2996789 RepID=UPI0022717E44|nr:DUF4215 domain-containing protein [Nannocystis sp. ILAH1]MCY0989818.1 DUF4215 domain-containing protein [Nannocystis sp. ILAH1]